MEDYKKITVASCLFAFTMVGSGITHRYGDDDEMTRDNLKVIPKSISKENLEILMTRYSKEIGAACNYCHLASKGLSRSEKTDFASDDKPEKKIAREMMKMTNRINKKYFGVKNTYDIFLNLPVTCRTCHRGIMHPIQRKLF